MSSRPFDDAQLDPAAERVADFLSSQIDSSNPASSSEREFVRRLASFRRLRRSRNRFAVGVSVAALLVVGGLAGPRFRDRESTAPILSYRVDNQNPPAGGYILVPQTADSLLAFSDGSKVRMAARTRGRVVEVNNRGAKVALDVTFTTTPDYTPFTALPNELTRVGRGRAALPIFCAMFGIGVVHLG